MPKAIGINSSVIKHATCKHCATINEYAPNEVILLWSGTDYGGGPDGARGFACVCCKKDVIVERW